MTTRPILPIKQPQVSDEARQIAANYGVFPTPSILGAIQEGLVKPIIRYVDIHDLDYHQIVSSVNTRFGADVTLMRQQVYERDEKAVVEYAPLRKVPLNGNITIFAMQDCKIAICIATFNAGRMILCDIYPIRRDNV